MWKVLAGQHPEKFGERCVACLLGFHIANTAAGTCCRTMKSISSLGILADEFPVENTLTEDLVQKLQKMRAKFKVITSQLSLGTKLSFRPRDLHESKNMTF
jgi:hypothetical protein